MPVCVLRLGHRVFRDQRITTHVSLVARAFGAEKIVYSGQRDKKLEESVKRVAKQWGGKFRIEYTGNWKAFVKSWNGKVLHLTAYGIPLEKKLPELKKQKNLLIIVGGEKVPPEVYSFADWNVSVSSQPHSEVSALAILLHEFFRGKKLRFPGAKLKVVPQKRGKKVLGKDNTL